MRKSLRGYGRAGVPLVCAALLGICPGSAQESAPAPGYSVLSRTMVERAEGEVERVRVLVEEGTLPRTRLRDAEDNLADARDDLVLSETLYGEARVEQISAGQAAEMLNAAQRRVERRRAFVNTRRELLDAGIISQAEFEKDEQELTSRERVLELARNRLELMDELKRMAETEKRLEQAAQVNSANVVTRYQGNGQFRLNDLTTISHSFEKKFHHSLPVSAKGQTLVHQSMLLDHSNRVDVALTPDQPEGVWLRQLLERLQIPYLAFRGALAGAATAPHIHIGPGSTRLKLAER